MPVELTLTLELPSQLGDPQLLLDQLRAEVAAVEAAVAAEFTRATRWSSQTAQPRRWGRATACWRRWTVATSSIRPTCRARAASV